MASERPFFRDPRVDCQAHVELVLKPGSGAHRFFRLSGPSMQTRFVKLLDAAIIPQVLIHGNPHIANYCKTRRGTAMADFDRSRIGPYAYDIVRFLVSVSLCRAKPSKSLLHPIILDSFRRGYLYGSLKAEPDFEEMRELRLQEPKSWQRTTRDYLDSGKKWAKKLKQHRVKITARHTAMLKVYLGHRNEMELLERYRLEACAEVRGSMGKMHHLYLLRDRKEKRDSLLFDIKEVYDEDDTQWFHNPFEHNGIRMNRAGEIYAPGWEQRPGRSQYGETEYWVRQIPTQQVKLEIPLSELAQSDLCFSVGSQLASGHCRAADKETATAIRQDFEERFPIYADAAQIMWQELISAHHRYCLRAMRKRRLPEAR